MRINNLMNKHLTINSQPQMRKSNQTLNNVSFKGCETSIVKNTFKAAGDRITDGISRAMIALTNTKPIQRLANTIGNSKKGNLHLMVAESVLLSGFYIYNTAKNKKIEKKQKPQMYINEALVCGFSAFATYKLDDKIANLTNKFADTFKTINKDVAPDTLAKYVKGIDTLKKVVIFTLIYRYLGPVLFTPIANKLSSLVQNRKKQKNEPAPQALITQDNIPAVSIRPEYKTPPAFKAFD